MIDLSPASIIMYSTCRNGGTLYTEKSQTFKNETHFYRLYSLDEILRLRFFFLFCEFKFSWWLIYSNIKQKNQTFILWVCSLSQSFVFGLQRIQFNKLFWISLPLLCLHTTEKGELTRNDMPVQYVRFALIFYIRKFLDVFLNLDNRYAWFRQ